MKWRRLLLLGLLGLGVRPAAAQFFLAGENKIQYRRLDWQVLAGPHKGDREIGVRESLLLSAGYISAATAFGAWVWWQLGAQSGTDFFTGFLIEKSLSMDNVFVIALIFSYFAIPRLYQHSVRFWGILGVIVLRGIMIGVGATLVAQYHWILYVFAAFLVLTGIKMLVTEEKEVDISKNPILRLMRRMFNVTDSLRGNAFFVREAYPKTGKISTFVTPLFLALVLVEIADLVFAVDSVPAVFAITSDPFIVYTSNIFAILGLRALYFALSAMIHRFHYLKYALAVLLIFICSKVFVADLFGWAKFPADVSLGVTFTILGAGLAWSLWTTRGTASARFGFQ